MTDILGKFSSSFRKFTSFEKKFSFLTTGISQPVLGSSLFDYGTHFNLKRVVVL